ncbi:glycoprotein 3 [Superficieibacter sp.]|uniref:glycoprotein 3 n=1 Tax=Superficieibacter sp. TaxID=2303322 RepID=UPI0028A7A7B2|nr:glycoprotein 3 [Superficieibacter sp.]
MTATTIPDCLKPAFEQLDTARAAHLAEARRMDDTIAAIARTAEQKAGLELESESDTAAWRKAFRAAGAVLSDELKNRHLMRVASRELAQECDAMTEVLNFERDKLKASCNSTANKYRQAHRHTLTLYAGHEFDAALRDSCGTLVRAMKLKILARGGVLERQNEIATGYVEPDEEVMQEVTAWLKEAVKNCHIRLNDEPVLFRAGLSAETLPHMNHHTGSTSGSRQKFFREMREREADLKARGLMS